MAPARLERKQTTREEDAPRRAAGPARKARPRKQPPAASAGVRSLSRDISRFVELLQTDTQLRFLRSDRTVLLAGMEDMLAKESAQGAAVLDVADIARKVARRVLTKAFKTETREMLEDCLRFRVWTKAEQRALLTALYLASADSHVGPLESNPVWLVLLALSIEDLVALEGAILPSLRGGQIRVLPGGRQQVTVTASEIVQSMDKGGDPRHYLFQPMFRSTHRSARLITDEELTIVVPLYEVLPMFLAVFDVWAKASDYGRRAAEQMPRLHDAVLAAFHKSAARTLDPDVRSSISSALAAESDRAGEAGDAARRDALQSASQFTSAFPWESNPIVAQLLLKLCSSPEICCVGPGAAEALKLAGDPTVADHYHLYGEALLQSGEFRGAGRVFASGLEFLGHHWRGLTDLARVYRALGDEKVAKKVFREALSAPDLTREARIAIRCEMEGVSRGMRFEPPPVAGAAGG